MLSRRISTSLFAQNQLLPSLLMTMISSSFRFSSSSSSSIRERIQKERERIILLQQTQQHQQEEIDAQEKAAPDSYVSVIASSAEERVEKEESLASSNDENQIIEDENEQQQEEPSQYDDDGNVISMSSDDAKRIYDQRVAVINSLREQRYEKQEKKAQWLVWQAGQREKGFENTVRRKLAKQVGRRRAFHHTVGSRFLPAGNEPIPVFQQTSRDGIGYHEDLYETKKNENHVNVSGERFSGRNKDLFLGKVEVVKPKDDDDLDNDKNDNEENLLFEGHDDWYYGSSPGSSPTNQKELEKAAEEKSTMLLKSRMFVSHRDQRTQVQMEDYWGMRKY